MQLYLNHKNFSVMGCLKPLYELSGWIGLDVDLKKSEELKVSSKKKY